MSLEAILEANTAALQTHTTVMQALLERLGAGGALAVSTNVAAAPAPAAQAADTAAAETKVEKPAADAKVAEVTYDQVKPLILKVNTTKGRDAATALLAEFGVTRGPELKPEQFAKFIARAAEVLA